MCKWFGRRLISILGVAGVLLGAYTGVARAGTTGTLGGEVSSADTGAPIADANVTAASPSQTSTAHTDASGRFVFLSLIPDTYSLTAAKDGYQSASTTGISVYADQSQNVALRLSPAAKSLGTILVISRSSLNPVRPGTTTDVYSVNVATTSAASTLGGGGGLNNAYSAIAAMPGAFVPPNQLGVNQTVYIRGGYYDQIGYEYDGVPMNRTFDNYPSHSASTLGQEELQIYTGGGSASSNATGLAGFINQVVKSGTYPGFTNLSARAGSPALYNDLSFETGGATDNHLFSYYVGVSGYNQDFRYLTNANGAQQVNEFPSTYPDNVTTFLPFWPAVYPTCNPNNPNLYTNPATSIVTSDPGCFSYYSPNADYASAIVGREVVNNFHFGIPHKHDSGMNDVQLLYSNSAQFQQYYSSQGDGQPILGALITQGYVGTPQWPDFYTYPAGTPFLGLANVPPIGYAFPGSPPDRCLNVSGVPGSCPNGVIAPLPLGYRDGRWDQASVVKAQYQDNMSDTSYLRAFGYIFYSNTNRSGAIQDGISGANLGGTNFDYELDAHTRGGELQYANQVSAKHELVATLNYLESRTLRYYNFNDFNSSGQQVSNLTNGTQCFAAADGMLANGVDNVTAGQVAPCNDPITQGSFGDPTGLSTLGNPENVTCAGGANDPIPPPACAQSAAWRLTFTGNQGEINSIKPELGNFSLSDDWKPNGQLDITTSLRFDRDEYVITPVASPDKNFWYAAAQKEFCYNPVTFQPVIVPEPPQFLGSVSPYVSFTCPVVGGVQTVHPDGQNGHILLSDVVPANYTQSYFSPRFGLTDTLNSNTVLRFSAGRFAQEPQNYEVEYNSLEPNLAAELIGFLQFGYNTPFHAAQAQFSNNYDASYERAFPGTDMAIKVTPFFRWATNQLYETISIPTLFGVSPSFNAGTERNVGLEIEFTKGDFNKNGFSGLVSYTYTNSVEKWNNYAGTSVNAVDPYNEDIQNFNMLTKAGGGSPCYDDTGTGTADPSCASTSILNPYYNMSPQPLLDRNGWYPSGLDFPYISPNTLSAVLSYRHDKFSMTPAFSLNEGALYGTPGDFQGLDPRTCTANQGTLGIPDASNPLTADYTSCGKAAVGASGTTPGYLWIPSPYTGTFPTFGQYRQPWQFNLGLQLQYDISPRTTANLSVVNLVNSCFGGTSEPWTEVYPPNSLACGYAYNKFFISNFWNGASPNDTKANGVPLNQYFSVPYAPAYGDVNSFNLPLPTQLFFQVQFKL